MNIVEEISNLKTFDQNNMTDYFVLINSNDLHFDDSTFFTRVGYSQQVKSVSPHLTISNHIILLINYSFKQANQ